MRLKALSLLPVLAVVCGTLVLPASSASAASTPITASLPITSLDQVVADSAQGYLFFSEGSDLYSPTGGTNAILVTNLDGNPVTTITGLSGVKGLALSPTGSTLYAALAGADEIVAISTTTRKVAATYSTEAYTPYTLAFEDGILWIGYENGTLGQSGVGYIDPAATDPTFVPQALPADWHFAPSISGDPDNTSASSDTGTLVAASPGETPTQVNSFVISGTTVRSSYSADLGGSYSPGYGLDVLPGGSQFVMDGSVYDTTDISAGPQIAYPAEGDSAAAVAPNGMMAIGYPTDSFAGDAGIVTFPSGSTTADPAGGYQGLGDIYSYVAGLAWSSNSSELFAVITRDNSSGDITGYTLQTLYPPTPLPMPPVPLSLSTSATTVGYKGTVKITVAIAITDDATMHSVNIYETPVGGQKKLLRTISLGSGWTTVFTSEPLTTSTAFTASTGGDSEFSATTTPSKTVDVYASVSAALSGYYGSKSTGGETYRLYHHTAKLKDAATVAPDKSRECVKLEIQHGTATGWKAYTLTGCTGLNSSSKATLSVALSKYTAGGKYRVRVDYVRSGKDTANLSTQGAWLYFIVEK